MVKNILAGLLMIALVLALMWASNARAAPVVGQPFSTPNAILCDEKSQIEDLIAGSKEANGAGLIPRYLKWKATQDAAGEPTCNIQPLQNALVKSVEDIGETLSPSGEKLHGYVVEITGTDDVSGWVLFGVKEATPSSDKTPAPAKLTPSPDLCEGRSASSYDEDTHIRNFWCS